MDRREHPSDTEREISSRSASVNTRAARRRTGDLIPPVHAKTWRIDE